MEDVEMFPFHHPADAIKLINSELDARRERSRLRQLATIFGRSRFALRSEADEAPEHTALPRHESHPRATVHQPESSAI
jgi:hypothetical protein